jgi:hypothetical protein
MREGAAMRPRLDDSQNLDGPIGWSRNPTSDRSGVDPEIFRELFATWFRDQLQTFFPGSLVEPLPDDAPSRRASRARAFAGVFEHRSADAASHDDAVRIFGRAFRIARGELAPFNDLERALVLAIGRVMTAQYHGLFRLFDPARLGLYQGAGEDHIVAGFLAPGDYGLNGSGAGRIVSTIQTLRTAALSTYENRRVSTGALLLGADAQPPAPDDALRYGSALTGLRSLYRLCDGKRTLFQVDPQGRLASVVDVARFADEHGDPDPDPSVTDPAPPRCARAYAPHARATGRGGHVCLVLSPNQEIKVFAGGGQVFAFAHGRWRLLDVAGKFDAWHAAVPDPTVARSLFQAALNLAETRHGALFVVVDDPAEAAARLLAPGDLLSAPAPTEPGPLAKRSLHYLARGRSLAHLDLPVLEALASLDGAVVADRTGRLLAFGAILRNDSPSSSSASPIGAGSVEGARTTAALAASRLGPVLKVSEDGLVSCFLQGTRAWDL